jgi:bifunctional DNA-binding transcriptional regulator/antitoxin component of YhaV-PrlF toxin-antitoxin module
MTLKLEKAPIVIPDSIRRKAGFRRGESVEFRVSGRTITVIPKQTADELDDQRDLRDPKIRAAIKKSNQDFLDGKSRPADELLAEITKSAKSRKTVASTKR